MNIDFVKDHIRNRSFMSGVQRDQARIKMNEECFTPSSLCVDIINQFERVEPTIFTDPDKTVFDPTCGDGQFLCEALIRKLENGIGFEQALSTIYGGELMADNVAVCKDRLLCGREDLRYIVDINIICVNGLEFDWEAWNPDVELAEYRNSKKTIPFVDRVKDKIMAILPDLNGVRI